MSVNMCEMCPDYIFTLIKKCVCEIELNIWNKNLKFLRQKTEKQEVEFGILFYACLRRQIQILDTKLNKTKKISGQHFFLNFLEDAKIKFDYFVYVYKIRLIHNSFYNQSNNPSIYY